MTLRTLLNRFDLLMDTPKSVPKLRQFILRLAIRGYLTERDPSDIPASVLLEGIQQEKQRLYDAGEIRKPKTFDSVPEDEIPFGIPSEWDWAYLGKIGRWGAGSTPKRSNPDYWDGGSIPWLKIGDLNNDHVREAEERVTEQALNECTFKLNQPGDVAVGMYGSIGKLGILEIKCVTNQAICVCTPMGGIPSRYLFYYLQTARETFEDLGAGGAQQNISKTKIVNTPLPLPPLEEQQRIVDTVDQLMDECDALEYQQERERTLQVQVGTAATEALQSADDAEALRPAWERVHEHFDTVTATSEGVDALRQTILQLAVQGRLTERDPDDTPAEVLLEQIQQEKQRLYDTGEIRKPSTFEPIPESEEPHEIPSEWEWVRVGEVGNTQTGQTPKKSEDRFYGGRYPFLKPDNIENGKATYEGETLTEAGIQDGRIVPTGSVLMVCIGTIGKVAVVDRKCSCNQQINYITPYGSLSSLYTLRAMQSASFQREAERKSRSTTITILNKGNWETIPFPLPPPEEQQRIVDVIDRLVPLCDHLDGQLADLNERGEQLLEAALRDASADQQDAVPTGATA